MKSKVASYSDAVMLVIMFRRKLVPRLSHIWAMVSSRVTVGLPARQHIIIPNISAHSERCRNPHNYHYHLSKYGPELLSPRRAGVYGSCFFPARVRGTIAKTLDENGVR